MKAKIIGAGIGVLALAGGLMFCGDEDFMEERVHNDRFDDDVPSAPSDEPATVRIEIGQSGLATPTFWAVRSGEVWSRPALDGHRLELTLSGGDAPYSVLWVCSGRDSKGVESIRTTIVEATAQDLPSAIARCSTTAPSEAVQLSGAIRNVDGEPVRLTVGTQSKFIENERQARDVLFSTTTTAGTRTLVAEVGAGEKMEVTAARRVSVVAGTPVEIDAANGRALSPTTLPLTTDGVTQPAGGTASLWINGQTKIGAGPLTTWSDGEPMLGARSTGEGFDYMDLRVGFRGPGMVDTAGTLIARTRFLVPADRKQPLPLPELTWVGPSHAYVGNGKIEFSWSRRNWAVFGRAGSELALFAPVAYVGSLHYAGTATHHLDVVVTPNRALGATPFYAVPDVSKIDGWKGRWSFPKGKAVTATSGNLTANAGSEAPNPAAAIAAYLDPEASPADLAINDLLAVVAAGSPTSVVEPNDSLTDLIEARCAEQKPCSIKIEKDSVSVEECPDLAAYDDCKEPRKLYATPADFVRDLQREILNFYLAGGTVPNGLTRQEALANISEEKVRRVDDREASEWWAYNPEVYQVYWHPDPTREVSDAVWYGAYLLGQLVSIYGVNWDGKLPDGEVDFCRLQTSQSPAKTVAGVPTDTIYASVFAKDTIGAGQAEDIEAQLGWASHEVFEHFAFVPMQYTGDVDGLTSGDGSNDQYGAQLTVNEIGTHHYVARFRRVGAEGWTYCDLDGNENGITPDQLGVLEVRDTGETVEACRIGFPQIAENVESGRAVIYRARATKPGLTGEQQQYNVVKGELMVGPPRTSPVDSPESFMTVPARPSAYPIALGEQEDEYLATFAAPARGEYAFAYRFSVDGGTTWSYCGLQDGWEPSGTFSPERMGAIISGTEDGVDFCHVVQETLTDDPDGASLPTIKVTVFDSTLVPDGSNAAQLEVEAAAIEREINPAWSTAPWTPLPYKEPSSEMFVFEGSPYTAATNPPVGKYNVVARVRIAGTSSWHYCDTNDEVDPFLLEAATHLTVAQ